MTMFCSVLRTHVFMSAICIFGVVSCSLCRFFTFIVVEVIEEHLKDVILNFSVLIVNSLMSIVPGCVSLQSSL